MMMHITSVRFFNVTAPWHLFKLGIGFVFKTGRVSLMKIKTSLRLQSLFIIFLAARHLTAAAAPETQSELSSKCPLCFLKGIRVIT